MRETPDSLPDRPSGLDSSLDVVGEVLGAVHLTTAVFGRLELGAPWRLRVPARGYLSFYVVARGSGWIEVGGEAAGGAGRPCRRARPTGSGTPTGATRRRSTSTTRRAPTSGSASPPASVGMGR